MAISQPTLPPFPVQDGISFREIPGHTGYAVCSDGSIWCCRPRGGQNRRSRFVQWRVYKPWAHRSGHLYCRFDDRGYQVHRLVLTLFVRPNEAGEECRHLDGNPKNNRLENLAWGTRLENIMDKARHGTGNQGERHCFAKMTNAQAHVCRLLHARHGSKRKNGVVDFVSRWYGLSVAQASRVVQGKTYVAMRC